MISLAVDSRRISQGAFTKLPALLVQARFDLLRIRAKIDNCTNVNSILSENEKHADRKPLDECFSKFVSDNSIDFGVSPQALQSGVQTSKEPFSQAGLFSVVAKRKAGDVPLS